MTIEQEPNDVKPEGHGKHPVSSTTVDKPSTPSPNGTDGTDSENPPVPRPPIPPQP